MFVQFVETHLWRISTESTLMFFSELKLSPVSTAIKICVMISIIFETYFQNKTTLPASFPLYSWKSIKIDDNAPFSNQSTIVFSFACLAFSLTCIHCLLLQSASTFFFRNKCLLHDAFEHSKSSKKFPKTETDFAAEVC